MKERDNFTLETRRLEDRLRLSVTTEIPPRANKLSTRSSFLYQVTVSGTSGDSSARQVKFMSLPTCTKTSRSPKMRARDTESKKEDL